MDSSDLSLVSTDELISEIVRRNQRTVVVMQRDDEEMIDGEYPFRIHSGMPEADEEDFDPNAPNRPNYRTIQLLCAGIQFMTTVMEQKQFGE